MPIARVEVSPLNGWKQSSGTPAGLSMSEHTFAATPDGQIAHYTDGALRATVPPEGWDDYAVPWPALADLAAEMRRNVQVSPSALQAAQDAIAKAQGAQA